MQMLKKKTFNIANDLDTVRFERIRDVFNQFEFSYEELKELFVKDGFETICQKYR